MRLIDADALKKQWTIASPEPYNTDAAEVIASIEEAPTVDAVPVVRCKDCRYYRTAFFGEHYCIRPNPELGKLQDDDFCSYGERKDDAHEPSGT